MHAEGGPALRFGWLRRGGGLSALLPVCLGVHGLKEVLSGILHLLRRICRPRHCAAPGLQRVHDRVVHRLEHLVLPGEFHLRFRGVDVDIHRRDRQRHLQHTAGEAALEKLVAVALL